MAPVWYNIDKKSGKETRKMKLTMDEMNMLLAALYTHSERLSKLAKFAASAEKRLTAKLFTEQADKEKDLWHKLIANLDEMTI